MTSDLLLIGSVPCETAEEGFLRFAPLAAHLPAVPDGEPGHRRWWVQRVFYEVLNGHPQLETIRRPAPDNGVERWLPRTNDEFWQFRIRDGVDKVEFGDPGWRLGFARDAINSYFVFKTLREKGVYPPGMRFLVSLPLVNSVIRPISFPDPVHMRRARPGYEAALRREIENIIARIPAPDLALQWDLAIEVNEIYQAAPGKPRADAIEEHLAQVRNLSPIVPPDVVLGIHFCFGTYGGWPRFMPDELGPVVDYANACVKEAGRPLGWIHIPAIDTSDENFYAPLSRLDPRGARVFVGLIHHMDTFKARVEVVRKFLPDFGVAAYCGLGRHPVETLSQTIDDHLDAVKYVKG